MEFPTPTPRNDSTPTESMVLGLVVGMAIMALIAIFALGGDDGFNTEPEPKPPEPKPPEPKPPEPKSPAPEPPKPPEPPAE